MPKTLQAFSKRTAAPVEDADRLTPDQVAEFCPDCAEIMRKKGVKWVSARAVLAALFDTVKAKDGERTAAGPGNIEELLKFWRSKEHPFTECKKWVEKHKGSEDYPSIKDADKFCGRLKHMVED